MTWTATCRTRTASRRGGGRRGSVRQAVALDQVGIATTDHRNLAEASLGESDDGWHCRSSTTGQWGVWVGISEVSVLLTLHIPLHHATRTNRLDGRRAPQDTSYGFGQG